MTIINLAPAYCDGLSALTKFRILSLQDLKMLGFVQMSMAAFYKFISRLEQKGVIKGFLCTHTKTKFVYLTSVGMQLLIGEKGYSLSEETLLHDAYACRVLLSLSRIPSIDRVMTESEFKHEFNHLDHRPDGLIYGKKKDVPFCLAMELELHQKSQTRIEQIFSYYSKLKICQHVLFLFSRKAVFEKYSEVLDLCMDVTNKARFMFLFNADLIGRDCHLLDSRVLYKGQETTLKALFQ